MILLKVRAVVRQAQKKALKLVCGTATQEEFLIVRAERDDRSYEGIKKKEVEERACVITSFGKIKELAERKTDMNAATALQPELRLRLNSLSSDSTSALSTSKVDVLLEAGLSSDEIRALVFANHKSIPDTAWLNSEDGTRLKLVAGVLARCLDVFGSEKKAIYWLHQPLSCFQRQSPLQFIENTSNIAQVDAYLTQVEEGSFA